MFLKKQGNVETKTKIYELSEIFEKFGKYQRLQYLWACLAAVFVTMFNVNYIFVVADVNYRCRVPECDLSSSSPVSRDLLNMTPVWWPGDIDRCFQPVINKSLQFEQDCQKSHFTNILTTCTEWVYENDNSVISELDLACQPWKSKMVGTIQNFGKLFSMPLAGLASDRFGRKPVFIFCAIGGAIGWFKTFATSYYVYIAIEFLESFISCGVYTAAQVIMIEIGGKKERLLSGVLFAYAIYIAESLFALIAMVVPYWKTLVRIVYSPPILFFSFIYLVRESPRWEIINGRLDQAKETLGIIAATNNLNIDKKELELIGEHKLKDKFNIDIQVQKESLMVAFKSKNILIRLFVASVFRFTASFVYYGLMVNSVLLPGDKHMNFLMVTVMSFPGELIALYLMNRIGRKLPLIVGFIFCGVMCCGSAYVPEEMVWLRITLFLIGKMVIAACFTGALTYNMELFPTNTRGSLMGICAVASALGSMLAPLTPMLNSLSPSLPSTFFGITGVLAGLLITLTPETKDLPLMNTVAQVDSKEVKRAQGLDNLELK